MALQFDTTTRNDWLNQITTDIGASGLCHIYSGPPPANVAAAATGTLLATPVFNATFAPAASGGVLTLNAITADTDAANTGTAGYFRMCNSAGTAFVQGTVTATGGGGDLTLTSTSISAGDTVTITSWTITAPGA